ncbi:hypothetical protein [Halarchaeum sp. P4]|uniref:hypothetical protein n=1 Tax=Halarchaeum sp. P4 TaxID=3421639 RepID=UPI003EBFDC5E
MEAKRIVLTVAVVLLGGAVVGGAVIAGVGPFGATTSPVSTGGDTNEPSDNGARAGGTGGNDTGNQTSEPSDAGPFAFTVTNVSTCGTTCRDVHVVLANTGERNASNVSVSVVITTGGDQIWQNTQQVGRLAAGASTNRTAHVELSYFQAAKVKGNGGKITIHTTVSSSLGTYSFTQNRDVA